MPLPLSMRLTFGMTSLTSVYSCTWSLLLNISNYECEVDKFEVGLYSGITVAFFFSSFILSFLDLTFDSLRATFKALNK